MKYHGYHESQDVSRDRAGAGGRPTVSGARSVGPGLRTHVGKVPRPRPRLLSWKVGSSVPLYWHRPSSARTLFCSPWGIGMSAERETVHNSTPLSLTDDDNDNVD